MPTNIRPMPPAAELWGRYSYNPLTGELFSRRRPKWGPIGAVHHKGYLSTTHALESGGNQNIRLNRLIWKWVTGNEPAHTVDHINRQVQDNRFWNLRDIENLPQQRNRGNLKLSVDKVRVIKRRLAAGDLQRVIAADYGVCRETIKDVKLGRIYSDVVTS